MKKLLTLLLLLLPLAARAQLPVVLHSHNDYERTAPFWEAYSQHCASIEADVFLEDGEILVAHERGDVSTDRTLRKLYVEPIVSLFRAHGGRMWEGSDQRLTLMVDLKAADALPGVVSLIGEYPDVFASSEGVRVVISGDLVPPQEFGNYPGYIWFDGRLDEQYTPAQLARVALVSGSFRDYARKWNGKGRMIKPELDAVVGAIEAVHALGKPIRFWSTPEGTTAYFTFWKLGVDIINTDHPATAFLFFSDWDNKNFVRGYHEVAAGVTGTHKLDRATRDFSGFRNEQLQLTRPVETYTPAYKVDGSRKKVKNIIFLIGDGMGLSQIAAGAYANGRDLSLLKIKHIGFQFNNPEDDFIADSASGGSTLATGEPSWTRHIASNYDGSAEVSPMTDTFRAMGKATGVVTMGDVADATPAVFYGHTSERDSTELITSFLASSSTLDLLCGSGRGYFEAPRSDGIDLLPRMQENGYAYTHDALATTAVPGKVVCIDDRMGPYATEETLDLLADITRESIAKLRSLSGKGFFLMVEGAKIDYAGHSDCFPASVMEQLAFDRAVAEALRFADEDGHTLVVVTADHETGGLTLLDGDLARGHVLGIYNSDDHTPAMIPVFAYGPGSEAFTGTYVNTEIARNLKKLMK